jgi:hypothetical protein
MIKSLAVAAVLTIGLAGYAVAQDTSPGAPAGNAPTTPAPGTPLPIPGVSPDAAATPMSSHKSKKKHSAKHMKKHKAAPAAAPAT